MNADGSDQGRLTDEHGDTSTPAGTTFQIAPAYSPDGTKIAFASAREGSLDVYVMDADGSGTQALTTGPGNESEPAWSPDGAQIAYQNDLNGDHVFVMQADGTGSRRLTTDLAPEIEPAWSPDSRWIAYSRRLPGTEIREIWIVHPDGSGRRKLTDLQGAAYAPAWSPDSKTIAFSGRRGTKPFQLYAIGVDGTGLAPDHAGGRGRVRAGLVARRSDDRVLPRRIDRDDRRRRRQRVRAHRPGRQRLEPRLEPASRRRRGAELMATVVLVGTLDTKGREYAYLADRVREHGAEVILVDAGIVGEPLATPDVTREEVAAAVGADVAALAAAGDRGAAVETMSRGAAEVVKRLHAEGRLDAVGGLGGSGGSALVTYAMRQLPIGVPKLMVSTVASGDTGPYVGSVDVTMMYSVVDIAGVNEVSARIMANAAGALAGMAGASVPPLGEKRPIVVASMFGVTTAAVTVARERLEELGYEVLVFHQTGAGGGSMEKLLEAGFAVGSLDVTTTEFCDQVAGGVLAAVPERLESAGKAGIPQVVSLGALDMVNFGPMDSVPERYRDRNLYVHNPTITLMRTTPDECREIARIVAGKLNAAESPTVLYVPLRGVSAIATEGQVFHDAEADEALFSTLRELVDTSKVEVHEVEQDVNDPEFALAMANRLHELIQEAA